MTSDDIVKIVLQYTMYIHDHVKQPDQGQTTHTCIL